MTFDPLAPELPPQNSVEQLLDDDAPLDDLARALLEAHLGMPGLEDAEGAFSPEVRDFGDGPAVLAFTHPGRLDRWLGAATAAGDRPEGKLVAHAAAGRALFTHLVTEGLPLALNAANSNARTLAVADMQAALEVPGVE
jgi:hypothetical protein